MSPDGPSWFPVDRIFAGAGGWYIGRRDGFAVGPYLSAEAAQAEAAALRRRLEGGGTVRDLLDVVRELLEARQPEATRPRRYGRMEPPRRGEPPRLGYRSPHLFAVYGRWYFVTREGIDVGPYPTRAAAAGARDRLLVQLQRCGTDTERRQAIVDFMTAARAGPKPPSAAES